MKRLAAVALSALVTLIAGCAPLRAPIQAEGAGPWDVILQMDVQHPTIAARFLDEEFAITVGDSGQLHYTADGGRTWERERVPVSIGQVYPSHDGTILTVADLVDSGRITVLRADDG